MIATPPRAVLEALRAELGPAFANPAQERFFDSHSPELLYSGAMGAGKSRILCEKAWRLAKLYPGATFGIFRKVAASIPATTLRTFTRDVMQPEWIAERNKSESWWQLTNGSRIYFLGLDADPITGVPSKVGSLDLAWAGVDEAVEITEADWVILLGRLRDPRMPWHQIAAATNPGPPTHWLKVRFTPSTAKCEYLHATAADNRFLPTDYKEAVANLPDNAIGRRLGKGEWAAVEGAIWSVEPHQIKHSDAPAKRVIAGLDWGFVHAFAVEVVGQSGSGRLSVRSELYAEKAGIDQLIEPLAALFEKESVSDVYYDPSEPGLAAQLSRGLLEHRSKHVGPGIECVLKVKLHPAVNDVMVGLQVVDRQLRSGMTVDPTCVGLLNEIPGYTWAPQKGGGYHERPIDHDDDACDALRYAVMSFEPDPSNPWAGLRSAGGVS